MRDRLPELLQRSGSAISTGSSSNGSAQHRSNSVDIKMAELNAPVDAILTPYSEIRVQLAQIAANLETMNRMVQTINIRNFNEKEMDELRNQNLKIGNQLMNKFREFKANMPLENDYCLESRMKRTLFYGLYQSYIQIWTKNEEFLQLYERKLKKNLELHSKIINCNSTEEEIEELIANRTTNLFVSNIIEETEMERRTLRDLMDRFSELKRLEKSIEDVHALFLRIQTLVLEQGDTLQRVEFHAQQATHYVDKGAVKIHKAEQLQKKAFRKKLWLIAIVAAVLIVLILIGVFL